MADLASRKAFTLRCMREHVQSEFAELEGWESRVCSCTTEDAEVTIRWTPDPFRQRGREPPQLAVTAVPAGWGLVLEGVALCPDCLLDAVATGVLA